MERRFDFVRVLGIDFHHTVPNGGDLALDVISQLLDPDVESILLLGRLLEHLEQLLHVLLRLGLVVEEGLRQIGRLVLVTHAALRGRHVRHALSRVVCWRAGGVRERLLRRGLRAARERLAAGHGLHLRAARKLLPALPILDPLLASIRGLLGRWGCEVLSGLPHVAYLHVLRHEELSARQSPLTTGRRYGQQHARGERRRQSEPGRPPRRSQPPGHHAPPWACTHHPHTLSCVRGDARARKTQRAPRAALCPYLLAQGCHGDGLPSPAPRRPR